MAERISSPGVSAPLPARPVAPIERTGDARLELFQRTLATMLGSQVPASVLARMQDGSFLVRVADTPVRMMLPPGTQPGTQLSMTVLAAAPQPTFGLGDATLHGTPVPLSSNAASLAASVAAASSRLLHMGGQAQGADLSPAARLLGQVLHSAAGAPPLASLNPATPLLRQGAPDAAQLAAQLQQAVSKSGLFYESHLAQWAEGKLPLAELMAEPQAQTRPGTPPTDPGLSQLVNQQLATQESGQLVWQGQLGPDQPLRWEIRRDRDDGGQARGEADEDSGAWHSGLRLRFALLGEVEASVSLRGTRLHIELAAEPGAAELLRAGAPRLQEALAAAGAELAALRIGPAGGRVSDSAGGRQQRAVALAYGAGAAAPTVVAKGRGLVAGQIIERAREAGVFVHESKELVSLLMDIDLDGQIPPALYRAIAELLAWLYHIESAQQLGWTLPVPPNSAALIDSPAISAEQDASNA